MITFSRTLLCELEEELNAISFDYDNPISMSDKSIGITVKHLQLLKNYVLNNDFQSHEDEIHSSKILNLNSLLN